MNYYRHSNQLFFLSILTLLIGFFSSNLINAQSFSLCSGVSGAPIVFKDFGNGTSQYSNATPTSFGFRTTYNQKYAGDKTNDGMFSFQNSIKDDFGVWHGNVQDHTPGDVGGYSMLVNADFSPGEFYRDTVNNLCIGSSYEFSVYLGNIFLPDAMTTYNNVIRPNVKFEIRDLGGNLLATINSGLIEPAASFTWKKYGLSFTSPSASVVLLMVSDAKGGIGNDIAIDDIAFTPCTPATTAITPIAAVCNNAPANIEVRVYGNADYKYYQWQSSTDKGNTWVNKGSYGLQTSNSLDYKVSLPISNVSIKDDSTIFRMVVATSVVSLSESNSGCRAFVYSETTVLQVKDFPVIKFPDIPPLCAGAPAITLAGLEPSGGTISGSANISSAGILNPSAAGTFSVKYKVVNGPGCSDSVSKTVTILPKPKVDAGVDQQICANTVTISLNGIGDNTNSFLWTGGTGTFSPGNQYLKTIYSPSTNELTSGKTTLTLLNTDTLVCPPSRDQIILTFEKKPEVDAGNDQAVCKGADVLQLAGKTSNTGNSIWSGGQGSFTPSVNSPTATYKASNAEMSSGSVVLTLTSTGGVLCPAASDQVQLNFVPVLEVFIADTFACVGETVVLMPQFAIPAGIQPVYEWSKDGKALNKNQPALSVNQAGVYNFRVSLGQCISEKSATVTLNPLPVSVLPKSFKYCIDDTNGVELNAGPGQTFKWKPNNETSQKIFVSSPGEYSVLVSNELNCALESKTTVKEVCPPRLFISNSFSPNSDGKNDNYNVYGAHFTNFKMFIFNRWGEVIFETAIRDKVWDGNYNGTQMTIGVYPWLITYEGDSDEYKGPYKQEGSVTIVK